ncbi:MAG: class I SAM-dependent methyltransferase [Actinomycetota bacterium]|nr:class I SAM-dependent methyltransferase [Actinomycetota bacterium]
MSIQGRKGGSEPIAGRPSTGEPTEGMGRDGYYDAHSEYQRSVAQTGAALIDLCVAATTLPVADESYVVADYGCSTGANSLKMVSRAISAVRARQPGIAAAALHNDVPTNDFNQLFANLMATPDSYLDLDPPVLPLVSAVSFFQVAAPLSSVRLGMSFSAAHWLSAQPDVDVPGGFYFADAMGDTRDALGRQAASDWATFLRARRNELAPGGRLLVQMVGTNDAGQVTARRLLHAMAEVGEAMGSEGLIDLAAVDRYILPVYARTAAEAEQPLHDDASLAAAFTIDEISVDPVPNPYLEAWRHDGDNFSYARNYAAFVRGFTESNLRLHLFDAAGDGGPGVVDEYFNRLEARFASNPMEDRFEDWTLTVVLARTADS